LQSAFVGPGAARNLQSHGGEKGTHQETAMTLNLTPRLTIRIRKATDSARHVVRTQTRRLSITSLSFLKMEVMVFKYNVK